MRVDVGKKNPALESLFKDPDQILFLDANFLIPPDRSNLGVKPISFQKYCEIWLDPVFDTFSNLAMHESVYGELVEERVKTYADERCQEVPPKLVVYLDSELSAEESALMQTYIMQIAPFSKYDTRRGNSKDKGEVLSLLYMAAKQFLYFASDDSLPKQLIRKADELGTGLQEIELIEMFDAIYYLCRLGKYDNKGLRMLYKYQYRLTKSEKEKNSPERPSGRSFLLGQENRCTDWCERLPS